MQQEVARAFPSSPRLWAHPLALSKGMQRETLRSCQGSPRDNPLCIYWLLACMATACMWDMGSNSLLPFQGSLLRTISPGSTTVLKGKSNYYGSVCCYPTAQPNLVSLHSIWLPLNALFSEHEPDFSFIIACSNPMLKQHLTISLKCSPCVGTVTIFNKDQKTLRRKETNSYKYNMLWHVYLQAWWLIRCAPWQSGCM